MLKIKYLMPLLIPLTLAASDQGSTKEYWVFERTAQNIRYINEDAKKLYHYFQAIFGKKNIQNRYTKPSELLNFFGTEKSGINQEIPLSYMSATSYLNKIIRPYFTEFDTIFAQKLAAENNNAKKTWEWFDGYFKQYGITEPFERRKRKLIEVDQQKIWVVKYGRFCNPQLCLKMKKFE